MTDVIGFLLFGVAFYLLVRFDCFAPLAGRREQAVRRAKGPSERRGAKE